MLELTLILPAAIIFVYLAFCVSQILGHNLTQCNWIWTNNEAAPSDVRTFQREFHSQEGKVPVSAQVLVASDQHDLFVNDRYVENASGMNNTNAESKYCSCPHRRARARKECI